MMQAARVDAAKYRRNVSMAIVAMLYSVYAIYASGKDAVFGGMLVWAIAFVIWAFIAFRFTSRRLRLRPTQTSCAIRRREKDHATSRSARPSRASRDGDGLARSHSSRRRWCWRRSRTAARRRTRRRHTGSNSRCRPDQARLSTDARPFSYRDESGQAAGYSVALCQQIADAAKGEPGLGSVSGGVGSGDGRRWFPCAAAGPDRPAVRGGNRDPRPADRDVVLDPDLPGRNRRARSRGRARPPAGGPVRTRPALPSDLARVGACRFCRREPSPPSPGQRPKNG